MTATESTPETSPPHEQRGDMLLEYPPLVSDDEAQAEALLDEDADMLDA